MQQAVVHSLRVVSQKYNFHYQSSVGDKVCSGAERTEVKSSTTNTGEVQTDEDNTVTSTTTRTAQT